MKLKPHLRAAAPERLEEILRFWRLEPDPAARTSAELAEYLYPRLQSPVYFRQAFDRLELGEREAVYLLALHGGELPVQEFRRRAGLSAAGRYEELADRLERRGFAWRETIAEAGHRLRIIGLPEPHVRLIELPPYWQGFIGHFLQGLSLAELQAISRESFGERPATRRKALLVQLLRDRLLDPDQLRQCLERLTAAEREIWQFLLQHNGTCLWREALEAGAGKRFDHERAESLKRMARTSGLVFVGRSAPQPHGSLLMIPRDLRHVILSGFRRDERTLHELSRSVEKPKPTPATTPSPLVILDNTQNALRDLVIVLAYMNRHHVKVLNHGGIGRNDMKRIVPLLSHNKTPKYVAFLALFAMARKLLIAVGDRWRVSKTLPDWLGDARRCYRELYEFWLRTNEWNEEYVDGDVVHVETYPQNLVPITELRTLVLRVLENVPVDAWIDFETFAESLLPQVAIEIPGRFDHAAHDRNNRHPLFILESMFAESLYWLGLVNLGLSDLAVLPELGSRTQTSLAPLEVARRLSPHLLAGGEYLFSLKVTSTGRQMFGGRYLEPERLFARYEDPALPYYADGAGYTIQPNLEIITPPDLNLARFYQLLLFTEVKKVDIMTTLALTRESLALGFEQGLTGQAILAILAEGSRKELPETAVRLIEECGNRHGEIDVGLAGGYILAHDPIYVKELRSNPRIARFVKDVLEEHVLLLNRTVDLRKLARELHRMGFVPRVASDTLHVTGEGLFHVTLRPEELYELLAILQFAQGLEEETGREGGIFEDRLRALVERLSQDARGDLRPEPHVQPLLGTFRRNYEKRRARLRDEEQRRLKKQVNRLLTRVPSRREPLRFAAENPTSDPQGILKMVRFAIENDMPVKIHYQRSTGDEIDEVIEPESLQGDRIYAFCPAQDEHRIYAARRVLRAAI